MVKKHFWWYVTSEGRTFWQTMEVQEMGDIITEGNAVGSSSVGFKV